MNSSNSEVLDRQGWNSALAAGMVMALALGIGFGWLRYWMGFFVLAQGAVAGALLAKLVRSRLVRRGIVPLHPGFGRAAGLAAFWTLAFWAGLLLGLGLAQPWFDSPGWVGRIWQGKSAEYVFGLAGAYVIRGFGGGSNGFFWGVLNFIDLAIMYFFFLALPWGKQGRAKAGEAEA